MKRARVIILLLVIVLSCPVFLFAEDWTSGITSYVGGAFGGASSWASGALSSGYKTLSGGVNSVLGASYNAGFNTMGALRGGYNAYVAPTISKIDPRMILCGPISKAPGFSNGISALGEGAKTYSLKAWNTLSSIPAGALQAGSSLGQRAGAAAQSLLSPSTPTGLKLEKNAIPGLKLESKPIVTNVSSKAFSYSDWAKGTTPYKQGAAVTGGITNRSVQKF